MNLPAALPPCVPAIIALLGTASAAVRAPVADSTGADTLIFVPAGEFTYAGAPRATLYGDLPLERTSIHPLRAAVVGGLYSGVWLWLHLDMSDAWWDGSRSGFRLKNDWNDVMQIDKAGHAFSGYMMSYTLAEGMMAAGIGWEPSVIAGSSLGLLYQTYVELEDGFSESWGFSLTDMAANTLGAGLYLAHHYSPLLQNFTPKYQYFPPSWIGAARISSTWIDDYNSSTFWISANIGKLLPQHLGSGWPGWLGLAFGYGITVSETERSRRFIVALDYDLTRLLPRGGHAWNWFVQTLNFIKLPAPAVEFSSTTKAYLLFPFAIRIGGIRI